MVERPKTARGEEAENATGRKLSPFRERRRRIAREIRRECAATNPSVAGEEAAAAQAMASPDAGRTPAQGDKAASTSPWPLRKLQSLAPGLWSQCKAYEDAFVERAKGTISDALVLVNEHQAEAIGCATVAGFIILRGPRRFLYRKTLGRFKTEKDLLNDAEQSMMEYKKSIEHLKKNSKYTLDKIAIGESDLQRGRTDFRSTGKQIRSLISSIYKAESTTAGLMDRLRTIPTRQSLELRAEVASMASDLKSRRDVLEERINKISEYGVRV